MSSEKYFRLQLQNVRRDQEEMVTLWCFDHGAEGLAENLPFRQNPEDYSVELLPADTLSIDAFFSAPLAANDLDNLKARFADVIVSLNEEQVQDWMAEWKKGFTPFPLVDGVWVLPHWLPRPAEAKQVILMEPGMAFGTGTHETTKLAAQLLADALRTRPGARVLDVGTGTGILAILAKLLGAREVVATDIDPEAVRVAEENFELNRQTQIPVSNKTLDQLDGEFDVVVANIIDGVLAALQSGLKRRTAPGGALVLSGIIDERLAGFRERFKPEPLRLTKEQRLNEWHGWLVERPR
ncbi:MAG: 50S ribosomal protein L11 methyltransferase [Bdellovibrionales bacterium]